MPWLLGFLGGTTLAFDFFTLRHGIKYSLWANSEFQLYAGLKHGGIPLWSTAILLHFASVTCCLWVRKHRDGLRKGKSEMDITGAVRKLSIVACFLIGSLLYMFVLGGFRRHYGQQMLAGLQRNDIWLYTAICESLPNGITQEAALGKLPPPYRTFEHIYPEHDMVEIQMAYEYDFFGYCYLFRLRFDLSGRFLGSEWVAEKYTWGP